MPLKWKIFLALNFVLSIPALVFLVLLFISFLNSYSRGSDYLIGFAFLFSLLLVTLNGFLNIYILQRFFPDKVLPPGVKNLNTLSLVLNSLVCIVLLILCIYQATLEFSRYNRGRDITGKVFLLIFSFLWVVQVIVLIMQVQLPRTISRNNRDSMRSLIDSIGQQ